MARWWIVAITLVAEVFARTCGDAALDYRIQALELRAAQADAAKRSCGGVQEARYNLP